MLPLMPLLTSVGSASGGISSLFGGGSPLGGGGGADGPATSAATGTFTTGGLTVTKTDSTVIAALVIGGLVLVMFIYRGRK